MSYKEHGNDEPKTLTEAVRHFSDEDICVGFMAELRWPNGAICPTCGSTEVTYLATRRVWKCKNEHKKQQFSIKVGTIFEDSPLPLSKWLPAMWLLVSCKNGISSYELHRTLGVTQKTGWFMLHRLRLAMQTGSFEKLSGHVEVDETFIGGATRFMHRDKRAEKINGPGTGGPGKTAVMGLLERHGLDKTSKVKAKVIPNVRRQTLQTEIRKHVAPGAEVHTDEWTGYKGIEDEYVHKVINHAEAYVRDNVHTNGIENFWSLLKRALKGTYISVEPFHLFRYVDEQVFRFNARKGNDFERFVLALKAIVGKRLMYTQLIGDDASLETA